MELNYAKYNISSGVLEASLCSFGNEIVGKIPFLSPSMISSFWRTIRLENEHEEMRSDPRRRVRVARRAKAAAVSAAANVRTTIPM